MADSQLAKMRDARRQPPPRRSPGSVLEVLRDALGGYLNRQGRYANEGLALADQGAGELQNANPWGALNMPLGALGYLTSPINALLPGGDEIDATNLSPEARRLLTAGTAGMMAVMPGGPKGPKGLGRGLGSLADDATDAERAALAGRLETEATQTGGQAVTTSRDEALRNLTEAPEGKTKKNFATQSYQETLPDGTVKWLPGTLRVNPPKKVFEPEMSPAYMRLLGLDPNKKYTPPKGMNSTAYKETYEDGTVEWVPGLMRVKRPPKQ